MSVEVAGAPAETSLLDAIASGLVPEPAPMSFSEWLRWRSGEGRRPVRTRDGRSTTMTQEAQLWRDVISSLHGEERAEELDAAEAGGELPSPRAAARTGPSGSGASVASEGFTPDEQRMLLKAKFNPGAETLEVYLRRLERLTGSLDELGEDYGMSFDELGRLELEAQGVGG